MPHSQRTVRIIPIFGIPRPRLAAKAALALAAGIAVAGFATSSTASTGPAASTGSTAADKSEALADKVPAGKQVDYAKDIQPIFKESCVRCHNANGPGGGRGGQGGGGPGGGGGGAPGGGGGRGRGPRGPAGGLRLDEKAQVLKGGKHGKAVVAGKAEESLLYKVLKGPAKAGEDEISAMPKSRPGQDAKPLTDEQIELIKQWIDQGAK